MSVSAEINRLALLKAMPGSITTLSRKTDICYKTASQNMRALRKTDRTHVGDWEPDTNGKPMAVYFSGPGVDAPKPDVQYERTSTRKALEFVPPPARYDDTVMPRAFFVGVR